MADNDTSVNAKMLDAVAQTALQVLGEAPAHSLAMVYQTMAHSLSLSMQNAITAQNACHQIGTSVVAAACAKIIASAGGGGGGGGGGGVPGMP